MARPDAAAILHDQLARRILVLDGAMGTMIQRRGLGEADYRGERFRDHPQDLKGDNEVLCLTRPDVIAAIHDEYLAAGADLIETNSFSSTAIAQADYRLEPVVYELNVAAAKLARAAVDAWTARTPDRPRLVAGALGPTNRTLSISPDVNDPAFRNITFDDLRRTYREARAAWPLCFATASSGACSWSTACSRWPGTCTPSSSQSTARGWSCRRR